jgi:threonine/homoserine/homoserine lactone efflux protein
MAIHSYLAFLSIVAVVHFTPGLVMMTLSLQTMNRGLQAGLLTLAGVELAELILISVVVLGFSSASANMVYVMRWLAGAGIVYLFYAAICAWRAKLDAPQQISNFGNSSFLNGFRNL